MPLTAEIKRLTELYALDILDSEPEPIFDSIVDLAKELLDMPVVLISLVDQNRQWFKACYGVDVREMPRNMAFCSYTVLNDDVLVVHDAAKDDRFKDNPLVTGEPGIRFYAGAPLLTEGGSRIGTLCVVDMKPHAEFTAIQQSVLKKLAKITMDRITLRSSIKDLQLLARVKGNFFATLSHEIRTPLGAVTACIHLFDKLGPLNEKQTMLYKTLKSSAENLESLVNDHLDFSKLENADVKLRNEHIDCTTMMSDIKNLMSHQAESKNLDLVFDTTELEAARVNGDEVRLRQILINLVSNSIKYTHDGSVKLSARLTNAKANDNRTMVFDITDTGIGIAEDDLDRIFDLYERSGDKQGAVIKGTGLGLAITKQLVTLMDGSISVRSELGKGSTFTVKIPVKIAQAA